MAQKSELNELVTALRQDTELIGVTEVRFGATTTGAADTHNQYVCIQGAGNTPTITLIFPSNIYGEMTCWTVSFSARRSKV